MDASCALQPHWATAEKEADTLELRFDVDVLEHASCIAANDDIARCACAGQIHLFAVKYPLLHPTYQIETLPILLGFAISFESWRVINATKALCTLRPREPLRLL